MANKLTIRELRRHLATQSQESLIDDIVALFSTYDSVKDFYTLRLNQSYAIDLLNNAKSVIEREFFPSRGHGSGRLSVVRKAITDFKKVIPTPHHVIDLMLHTVELGVAYTNQYGDINAPFYTSMERTYKSTLQSMFEHGLENQFQQRCDTLLGRTRGIGWGFADTMLEIHSEYFSEAE